MLYLLFTALAFFLSPLPRGECTPCLPEAFFSPHDDLAKQLTELIGQEKSSLKIAIFQFTHRDIAKALIEARQRGVEVELIVDKSALKSRALLTKLERAGVTISVFAPSDKGKMRSLMHDKFCIFGGKSVWSGSFNFTNAANVSNWENALLVEDPKIASRFSEHFLRIKTSNTVPLGVYLASFPSKGKKRV